jgi:phospholipid transport system substrate-binding protein
LEFNIMTSTPLRPAILAAVMAAGALALSPPLAAAPADPAAAKVDAFDAALLASMKAGAGAGVKGRDRELTPAVESAFDLATMARYAVGPAWNSMSEAQHAEIIKAFGRYTTANYAHNFDSFSGQKFVVGAVQDRGADKIVQAQLVSPHDAPVNLIYRLHQTPAGWKIIDVYYNGISQLTTRRADFAASVQVGPAALVGHLESLTSKLLG